MIRALWLASWYPSKAFSQNGDFIQRHARAVSRFASVYVLHVVPFYQLKKKTEVSVAQTGNLTEEIVLYKKTGNHFLSRFCSFYRYLHLYKKHIRHYIDTYGKPDIVHVHVAMRAGLLALWLKRKYHIPYIITEHSTVYTKEDSYNFYTKNYLFRYCARKIFKQASRVLPVSNGLGKSIQQMVVNVPFIKIPNVVSDDFYFKKIENNLPFTFIHVSSLNELKNPEGILHAYAKLLNSSIDVLLKMVGKNYEPIKLLAKELNIPEDKIIFTGEVSNEQVAAEMQSAQAFILFSHSENFPCVVIESLCCGVPVIATDVGGVAEQIDDTNGILVSANDEPALLEAMKKMIENYAHYDREKISERAKALYNYDVVGKQIVEIYRSVTEH